MVPSRGSLPKGTESVRRDRIEEDIYVFVSEQYAQVTATVLLTADGAIVIDTLPFPSETREMLAFVESRLGPRSTRYVVLTHHHADHVYGAFLFEGAEVISHDVTRDILLRVGEPMLARAKQATPALAEVELRIPDITFERQMHLRLGDRHVRFFHTPGHSSDAISAYVLGAKVVVAGDSMMPVPYIARGNMAQLRRVLQSIKALEPDFVVQGHGNVLLRGEVGETVDQSLDYLDTITERVRALVDKGAPAHDLQNIPIEACGLSRIPLDGLVSRLHLDNLVALYKQEIARREAS